MTYREEIRDLFSVSTDYVLAHCISADFVMGAGIAVAFVQMGVKNRLIQTERKGEWENCGYCIFTGSDKGYTVGNLITKEKVFQKPTYHTVRQALEALRVECHANGYKKIAMPLIACGIDGLSWDKVSEIIKKTFANEDIEILVCRR